MNIQGSSIRMNMSSHYSSKNSSHPSSGKISNNRIQKDVIVLKDPSLTRRRTHAANSPKRTHLLANTDTKAKTKGDQRKITGSTLQDLIRMKNELEQKTQLGARVKMASPVALTDPSQYRTHSSIMMSQVSLKKSSHVRGSIVSIQQSNNSTKKTHQSMVDNLNKQRELGASPPNLIANDDQMRFNNQPQYSLVQSPRQILVNSIPTINKVVLPSSKGATSSLKQTISKSNQTQSHVQSSQFRGSIVSRSSKTLSKCSGNSFNNKAGTAQGLNRKMDPLSPRHMKGSQSTNSLANVIPSITKTQRTLQPNRTLKTTKTAMVGLRQRSRQRDSNALSPLNSGERDNSSSDQSSSVSPNRFNVQSVVVRGRNQNQAYNSVVHLGIYSSKQGSSSAIYSGGNAMTSTQNSNEKNRLNKNKPSQSEVMPEQQYSSVNNGVCQQQPRSYDMNKSKKSRLSPSNQSGGDSSSYNYQPSSMNISKQMKSGHKRDGSSEDKRRNHSSDRSKSNDSASKQGKISSSRQLFTSMAQTAATKSVLYSQRGTDHKQEGVKKNRVTARDQLELSFASKNTPHVSLEKSDQNKIQSKKSPNLVGLSTPKPKNVNNIFDDEKQEQNMRREANLKNNRRRRYNPYKDPNFDVNSNKYTNTEFRQHSSSPVNTHDGLIEKQIDLNSNLALEKIEESLEQQETESLEGKSEEDISHNPKERIIIKQCKLKRQRFEAPSPSKSQVKGGKLFRQSQVQSDVIQSFASKIKANSLSDIESIHSEEEQYTSSQPTPIKHGNKSTSQVDSYHIKISEDSNEDDESSSSDEASYRNSNVGLQRVIQPGLQVHNDKILQTIQSTTEESTDKISSNKNLDSSPQNTPMITQGEQNSDKIAQASIEQPATAEFKKEDDTVELRENVKQETMNQQHRITQPSMTILHHQQKYDEYVNKRKKDDTLYLHENDYANSKKYLQYNGIHCIKYNYSFGHDEEQVSQKAMIQLSPDGEHLVITTKKPIDEHTYEYGDNASASDILKQKMSHSKHFIKNTLKSTIQGQQSLGKRALQYSEEEDESKYTSKKSNASCKISDINGLIFGGFSSRFWMLRKHINSLDSYSLKHLPFHCWNCITITIKNRDIDLVIKNEKEMNILLKFLIYTLKTVDGIPNTAPQVIEALNQQSIRDYKEKLGKDSIKKSKEIEIIRANEYNLYNKVFFKYLILKIRLKISFMALQKNMTVPEVIYNAILQSFKERSQNNDEGFSPQQFESQDRIYSHMLDGDQGTIKRLIEKQVEHNTELQNNHTLKSNILKQKCHDVEKKEVINVKKNGIIQEVLISLDKNESKQKEIKKILQKNQCIDIFKDLIVDDEQMAVQDKGYQRFIQYKFQKKSRDIVYQKLKMMCCMGMLQGQLFIRAMLKRIELQKEMLLIEIELGREVLLANELSQDKLPMSFTYYDSIIRFIQSNITTERRDYYNLRKQLANIYYNDTNKKKIKDKNGEQELIVKQIRVNKMAEDGISLHGSQYCYDLQRSRYIQIDDSVRQVRKSQDLMNEKGRSHQQRAKLSDTGYPEKMMEFNKLETNISVQYLQHDIVNAKRQKFLKVESLFQQQTSHLKLQGQKQDLAHKVVKWLENYVRKKVAHTCTHGQNQFLLNLRMKNEAKQMEKTMRSNKTTIKSEQDNAKTLLAAMMTEQKGEAIKEGSAHGHDHDGGENEKDSEDEEIEDMEALNKSLSQDVQYHGGQEHQGDGDHGDEMGMLQKSVFNLLSQESEKLIKDLYLKYRHRLRSDYRNRCQPKINYEKKKKYVEDKIEKDILYFETNQKATELQNIKDQIKRNLELIKKKKKLLKQGKMKQDEEDVGKDGEDCCLSFKRELEQGSSCDGDNVVSDSHKDSQAKTTSHLKSESKKVTSATPSLITSVASSKKYVKQAVHTSAMRGLNDDPATDDQRHKQQTLNTSRQKSAKQINLPTDKMNRDKSEQPRSRQNQHLAAPQSNKKKQLKHSSRQSSSSSDVSDDELKYDHNVMNSFNKLCLDVKTSK